jgi:hypothetical protein
VHSTHAKESECSGVRVQQAEFDFHPHGIPTSHTSASTTERERTPTQHKSTRSGQRKARHPHPGAHDCKGMQMAGAQHEWQQSQPPVECGHGLGGGSAQHRTRGQGYVPMNRMAPATPMNASSPSPNGMAPGQRKVLWPIGSRACAKVSQLFKLNPAAQASQQPQLQ